MSERLPDYAELSFYQDERDRFVRLHQRHAMPQISLLSGRRGLGKRMIAAQIASLPFCESHSGCGECSGCRQVIAGLQDEILWIESDDGKLKVEHADLLKEHLEIQPGPGALRTVVIVRSEELLSGAANRLLKILEEPPPKARIIMTTDSPKSLLPTILSRTVRWRITPPPVAEALAFLEAHGPSVSVEKRQEALYLAGMVPEAALASLLGEEEESLLSQLDSDMLTAGEKFGRKKDWDPAELVDRWEIAINREYRMASNQHQNPLRVQSRRKFLRQVRGLLRAKVPVNRQMLVEQIRGQMSDGNRPY